LCRFSRFHELQIVRWRRVPVLTLSVDKVEAVFLQVGNRELQPDVGVTRIIFEERKDLRQHPGAAMTDDDGLDALSVERKRPPRFAVLGITLNGENRLDEAPFALV